MQSSKNGISMSIITNDLDYIKKESDVLEDGLKDIKNDMIIFEHYMDMTIKLLNDKNISEKLNICFHSYNTNKSFGRKI